MKFQQNLISSFRVAKKKKLKKMQVTWLSKLFVSLLLLVVLASGEKEILRKAGKVEYKGLTNGVYESYLGIRYAQPPVGSLRWGKNQNYFFFLFITKNRDSNQFAIFFGNIS